jgi:hypothetical protein
VALTSKMAGDMNFCTLRLQNEIIARAEQQSL